VTQVLSMPLVRTYARYPLFRGKDVSGKSKSSGIPDQTSFNQNVESQDTDFPAHDPGRAKRNKKIWIAVGITTVIAVIGGITGGILGSRKSSTTSSPTMSPSGSSTIPGATSFPSMTSASPTPTSLPSEPADCPTLLNGTAAVAYGGNGKETDFTVDYCPSYALVNLDKPKSDDPHLLYYLYRKPDHRPAFDAYDDYIGEVRRSMDGLDNAWNNDGTLQGTTNSSSSAGKVPFIAGSTKSLLDFLTGKTDQYPNFNPQNMTDQAGIVERAEDGNSATIFTYQFNPDGTLAGKEKIGVIKNNDDATDPASPEAATLASYIAKLKPGNVFHKK